MTSVSVKVLKKQTLKLVNTGRYLKWFQDGVDCEHVLRRRGVGLCYLRFLMGTYFFIPSVIGFFTLIFWCNVVVDIYCM